ncbi:hypothetical protein AB3X82_00370 [Paraburkholderia phenoliruptrix]|uniref:Uncharacterized protein n=1 Tax=Paraburkholderia phenoliruptrix TaxID=252970 RepID=A0ABV3W607_9BURK|nr:hypothetical protein [Paraburkholderia phenoliruptrix]MDR6390399.1 hypothetical protein [Paraburkholderia phenoliruptrix]
MKVRKIAFLCRIDSHEAMNDSSTAVLNIAAITFMKKLCPAPDLSEARGILTIVAVMSCAATGKKIIRP